MKKLLLLLLLFSSPAWAQAPEVDPRLAGPLVRAQKAELDLREVIIKLLQETQARREQEWLDYSKSLWKTDDK